MSTLLGVCDARIGKQAKSVAYWTNKIGGTAVCSMLC